MCFQGKGSCPMRGKPVFDSDILIDTVDGVIVVQIISYLQRQGKVADHIFVCKVYAALPLGFRAIERENRRIRNLHALSPVKGHIDPPSYSPRARKISQGLQVEYIDEIAR